MTEAPEFYARIYARHGHRCPMSTLGGRLGLAALERLSGDCERAQYGIRTCALDGIAEATGCCETAGTLEVVGDGRHRLELFAGEARVAAELTGAILQRAGEYRRLSNRLEADWEDLDSDERHRRRTAMEAALDELLPELWAAPEPAIIHFHRS